MKFLNLILLAGLFLISCSEEKSKENKGSLEEESSEEVVLNDGRHAFGGTLGEEMEVNMYFQVEGESVEGYYYYLSQKKEIELKGRQFGDSLVLKEYWNGKHTGTFHGVNSGAVYQGEWRGNGKVYPFLVYRMDMEYYIGPLDSEGENMGSTGLLDFEEYINKFEWKPLPFEFDALGDFDEDNPLEEDWVWSFIDSEYDPEEIGSNFYPFARFNAAEYIGILVHHWYYPGAFGINNNAIILYTFDNDGQIISKKNIACFCYDSNQAGLYYDAVYPTVNISSPEGQKMIVAITVDNIYESGTNFPEEVPEDEIVDERSEGQDVFYVSKYGDIVADHEIQ